MQPHHSVDSPLDTQPEKLLFISIINKFVELVNKACNNYENIDALDKISFEKILNDVIEKSSRNIIPLENLIKKIDTLISNGFVVYQVCYTECFFYQRPRSIIFCQVEVHDNCVEAYGEKKETEEKTWWDYSNMLSNLSKTNCEGTKVVIPVKAIIDRCAPSEFKKVLEEKLVTLKANVFKKAVNRGQRMQDKVELTGIEFDPPRVRSKSVGDYAQPFIKPDLPKIAENVEIPSIKDTKGVKEYVSNSFLYFKCLAELCDEKNPIPMRIAGYVLSVLALLSLAAPLIESVKRLSNSFFSNNDKKVNDEIIEGNNPSI